MEKKPHLVNWATVCIDKKVGGLGGQRFTQAKQSHVRKVDLAFRKRKEFSVEGGYQKKVWENAGGGGVRGSAGIILGHACGKKLGKTGRLSF